MDEMEQKWKKQGKNGNKINKNGTMEIKNCKNGKNGNMPMGQRMHQQNIKDQREGTSQNDDASIIL
jgi:hypothetical protein